MRIVIAIIARFASGKSACVEYIKQKYNYSVFEIGDYVRKLFNSELHDFSTLIEYAEAHYKQGKLDKFIKEAIAESTVVENNIIFVGIRSLQELDCFLSVYPEAIIMRIDCDTEIRKRRYNKLLKDMVSFEKRDRIENLWIDELWSSVFFDYIIVNNDSIHDLYKNIDDVFLDIVNNDLHNINQTKNI